MDLTSLAGVYGHPGPFVTLHLEVGRGTADAAEQVATRWSRARSQLDGALPGAVLDDLEERFTENLHAPGEVRRTVVVGAEGAAEPRILLDDIQPGHSHWPETVDVGVLPDLTGWLGMADRGRPFVLALADRTGADLEVHRGLSDVPEEQAEVTGETFHLTKVAEGDWAQKQFQQTAENAWVANARLVADEMRSRARRLGIRTLVVAGEVRARAEVLRALGDGHPDDTVVEVEHGGRAAGASAEAMWQEITQRLVALDREADAAVAQRLDEGRARGDTAATGVDEVVRALQEHRVERLVLDPEAMGQATVEPARWPGLPLPDAATSEHEVPADRALVAAAALTGAEVSLLPASMSRGGGVAALLRWS